MKDRALRHTKIIATIGPASDSDVEVEALISAGVDVFRINFSHGNCEGRKRMYDRVRAAASRSGRVVSVLMDLSGPKIRTGRLADGANVNLVTGATLRIETGDFPGSAELVSTSYMKLARVVTAGDRLMLDDGRIELRVVESDGFRIVTQIVHGGVLGERKGINVPGVDLSQSALTDKDMDDLEFGLELGVDFVAVSFVQSSNDLQRARDVARRLGRNDVALVAKIEHPKAVDRFADILAVSDAVMVARGDLGLEIPLEQVPRVQKDLTRRARAVGVPVIVATQVLDTMRYAPRPTRAEVSDAANAVDDSVDAIMLAGETAVGSYPVLAVRILDSVIRDAESVLSGATPPPHEVGHRHGRALCEAAVTLAETSEATGIVAVTLSGATVRQLAALRPRVPIHGVTDNARLARRLTMYRGVVPATVEAGELETRKLQRELLRRGTVASGDLVAFVRVHSDLSIPDANFVELQRC